MQVKKYHSKVVSILKPLDGIYTIEFKSLDGIYKYNPGQFLHLAMDQEYDGSGQWPESRCFSMQSNPDEESIRITYCVKGRFTHLMEKTLKVEDEVWLKLPFGNLFTQNHNKSNTVFIAGGTGITPFLSLFNYGNFNQYINPKIYLGFRSHNYNIYEQELKMLKIRNRKVFLKFFYEDEDGFIDINEVFLSNGLETDYFISGPPIMIHTFKKALLQNGVSGGKVLTDDWE